MPARCDCGTEGEADLADLAEGLDSCGCGALTPGQVAAALRTATPPRTRGDCVGGPRPCPWARCRYALPAGVCALDVADGGPSPGPRVAELLGISKQGVLDIEKRALAKLEEAVLVSRRERFRELMRARDRANGDLPPGHL